MRISELSSQTGVPVATIKFYLREKLLQEGIRTSATQAQYNESHVARLRLIRPQYERIAREASAAPRTCF